MLGNIFSQPRMNLSGSGALSHVYIQQPPLRCSIPETQGLFYDDGNKLLLSPTSDQVLSWKIGNSTQVDPPDSDSISEGPVLSIRYSLDKKVIGIQRSNHEIQFKNRETGETFSRRCRPDSESILGFFWTDSPYCDVIFIKTSGIDLLSYEPELNTLRLVEAKKFNVSWYIYTHESRMVLLASGMQCTIFYGFQFSSAEVVRLPKFEMTLCKPEANQKPVLAAEDVHIVTVYGRIYCLQVDRVGMILNLYRFYRDAVVQQGTLPIYSSRITVSVVDNVLLVHQIDAKVVILYDIFLDSLAPVSAPLPLLLRGPCCNKQIDSEQGNLNNAYGGMIYGDSWKFLVPDLICDVDNGMLWRIFLDLDAIAASSSDIPSLLDFLQRRRLEPNKVKLLCLAIMRTIILERRPISIVSRAIDVLVASYSQLVKLGNALGGGDRRASEKSQYSGVQHTISSGALPQEAKSVAQGSKFDGDANLERHEKSLSGDIQDIQDREAINNMKGQTSGVNLGQSLMESGVQHNNNPVEASVSPQMGSQNVNVAISPDEMYHFILAVVEDEMVGDPSYLVSVIIEFLRSVSKEIFKVHPNVYVMTIQLLTRSNRDAELGLFIINKIIEPSKEAALQLLESGHDNLQTRKLGIEMLRQLSLHHDYVNILLQDGHYLEALRYARKNKVITVRPLLFLEAALASNNSQHLAAVLRFFSDFTPGFKSTSEFTRFHQILTEMY
ncbi:uncharacterized protein A4U43_C03F12860 [Asparagus officinalis]|uniref:Uncharacterized protein n=1 Tax=Asparagus officinalis TaxID=4686 RepID=A0A5P1F9J0_ASPOF|nr:uncharacterized protein C18orf8 [Asparagus officinalis]XP_020256883.1 uncharacterized protein C18orf8 [Asparagus officinalis]ONK75056.1 uncharacterized protein A4U43_C03F12860 [Asparagus officinalis]